MIKQNKIDKVIIYLCTLIPALVFAVASFYIHNRILGSAVLVFSALTAYIFVNYFISNQIRKKMNFINTDFKYRDLKMRLATVNSKYQIKSDADFDIVFTFYNDYIIFLNRKYGTTSSPASSPNMNEYVFCDEIDFFFITFYDYLYFERKSKSSNEDVIIQILYNNLATMLVEHGHYYDAVIENTERILEKYSSK